MVTKNYRNASRIIRAAIPEPYEDMMTDFISLFCIFVCRRLFLGHFASDTQISMVPSVVMYMFTPLTLITNDTNHILWKEQSPASSYSCRPLSLMLSKETDNALKEQYRHLITEKRAALQQFPLIISCKSKQFKIDLNLTMSLIDGKMRSLLSGLSGAFCILCTCTRNGAIDIEQQFDIDRDGQQIQEIWRKLVSGELVKKPHDQAVRMGVTREPLVALEDIAMLSPLHCLLRIFDFILKIVYHLNAGIFNWADEKNVLGDSYELLRNSKEKNQKNQ